MNWDKIKFYLNERSFRSATRYVVEHEEGLAAELPKIDSFEDGHLRICRVYATYVSLVRESTKTFDAY